MRGWPGEGHRACGEQDEGGAARSPPAKVSGLPDRLKRRSVFIEGGGSVCDLCDLRDRDIRVFFQVLVPVGDLIQILGPPPIKLDPGLCVKRLY